jgi:hypothetical protein
MWKYLAALMLLLTIGVVGAQVPVCTDCYANVITQTDTQTVENVKIGVADELDLENDKVGVGNEGLSAAIIVTPKPVDNATGSVFRVAGFARIDQVMNQRISGLGTTEPALGEEGAKGLTWNKAIQAAWIANQGLKEAEEDEEGNLVWVKEGAYIAQTTNQNTLNIYDYDSREEAKILNVDNKLAMIVDDLQTVINLTATADSTTTDSQESTGNVYNDVNITVAAKDP